MAESDSKNGNIHQKLDKIHETQAVITNYLYTLNQFILQSHFNVNEQFSDTLTALQFGSTLMGERLKGIKSEEEVKENSGQESKDKKGSEEEDSDIFSKFPHSALITPSSFLAAASPSKNIMIEPQTPVPSTSIAELYENIAKAPGSKAYKRNFPAVLKSPNLSIVAEGSNTSLSGQGSAPPSQSSILSPITRRKPKTNMPPLTPNPCDLSSRPPRRITAPSSFKEPSLKKKMRRT